MTKLKENRPQLSESNLGTSIFKPIPFQTEQKMDAKHNRLALIRLLANLANLYAKANENDLSKRSKLLDKNHL